MLFSIVDECHQDLMCICTELNLRGGVSCMPAALIYIYIYIYYFLVIV